MLKERDIKININICNIFFLIFIILFFNVLSISKNTTLILDFINLFILNFIIFYFFFNFNLNYMFIALTINYNRIKTLLISKFIYFSISAGLL